MTRSAPAFLTALHLEGRRCLVVGSGEEAERRVTALVEAGAEVRWVTRGAGASATPGVRLEPREVEDSDLQACWLAVLTDRDSDLNLRLAALAERERVLYCGVDMPGHNSFSHVALVHAGDVTLAISTNGTAPALARALKRVLQQVVDEAALGDFARRLAELRQRLPARSRRRRLLELVAHVELGPLKLPNLPRE